MMVAYLKFNST